MTSLDVRVSAVGGVAYDIGDLCTHCGRDTSPGGGLWVDRIPSYADAESASEWLDGWDKVQYLEGYLCRECLEDW